MIEVPDHVYVLVISSSVSDCCISVFRFSWSCFIIFRLPTPFRIPRLHMCIRSACQGCRFENVPHYLCHVIRHTRIKLRCSDVTISHFSPSYEIFPANRLRLRHIHVKFITNSLTIFVNWNFQEILTNDPSSAWGCDTSGNIPLCGVALRRTCRCTEFHRVKNANLRHPSCTVVT